jgi:uncharacterized damage-inducible protein DinB
VLCLSVTVYRGFARILPAGIADVPGSSSKKQQMTHLGTQTPSDFAGSASDEFARYFRHLGERVDKAARSVTEAQFWIKPFPFGNSIGHLVLHLTGNLNHYIGALVAGTGYTRHREHEFTDATRYPRDEVLAKFHQAIELVVQTLSSQDESAFLTPVHDQPPVRTRLGLFLVCAAHLNNHVGQMSYLVQALQASTNEQPVW